MSHRERILGLLRKKEKDGIPCFSGMGNVITEVMKANGIRFAEAHTDPQKMATLAGSMYKLYDYECAVVPFDLGIEAEVLGCPMNFYTGVETDDILYPTIKDKIVESARDIKIPENPEEKGRVPVVTEAIRLLRRDVGDKVAIGTYLLGPFTLAGQVMELDHLLKKSFKDPGEVEAVLEVLSQLIITLGKIYKQAGADYITLREMGACTDVMNPRMFKTLVQPHLIRILKGLEPPRILHICGGTNQIIKSMEECGAEALSVDHKNDLRQSRQELKPETLLFGNLDTYTNLVQGTPVEVEEAVKECLEAGVDAIWPGCDIWPTATPANIRAMIRTTREFIPDPERTNLG